MKAGVTWVTLSVRLVRHDERRVAAALEARVLELRPNCELCDRDLAPEDPAARICSYECTFCDDCVSGVLHDVCPNCGGGFVPRPIRPRQSWRDETGLAYDPPSGRRRQLKYSMVQVEELVDRLRGTPPERR